MSRMENHAAQDALAAWLLPALVVLLTAAAFLPALHNGFVNWDDEDNYLRNLNFRGLGWTQIEWMFTTFHGSLYRPLTWITLGLDYLLWRMNPFGYHLTSLLLHVLNALLFYFLALRLFRLAVRNPDPSSDLAPRIAAGFAALLFAVHPLRVEPVAWVSARNDPLCGVFFLSSLLCYLKAGTDKKRDWLSVAAILYAFSLLSKASAMMLPMVLLVLDVYPLGRLGPGKWFGTEQTRVWREKVPFMVLGFAAALVAVLAKSGDATLAYFSPIGMGARLAQALYGIAFYLWKTIIPIGLSPLYELPANLNPWEWRFIVGGAASLAVTVVAVIARRSRPDFLASWAYYVILILPVSGVIQSGPQLVADRYSYLSCLGWALLAGVGVLLGWNHRWRKWIFPAFAGVLFLLGALTWRQAQVWHDSEKLWKYVLATTPQSSIAHNNLGVVAYRRGELEQAMEHYRQSLQIRPDNEEAQFNLGVVLAGYGKLDEAMEHYRKAFQIRPDYADAHYNLGNALYMGGRSEEAMEEYRQALRSQPDHALAHYNLGNALYMRGQLEEAMEHYRAVLRIDPRSAEAHNNLGAVLAERGQLADAMIHYRQALGIDPHNAEAHNNLGNALFESGQLEKAIQQYRQALDIDRNFSEARQALTRALKQQSKH
jgi:tetratricopeptide (TPR) repeat protein